MAEVNDQPESEDPFELSFDEEEATATPKQPTVPTPAPAAETPVVQAPPPAAPAPAPSSKPMIVLGALTAVALVVSVLTGLIATRGLSKANIYMEAAEAALARAEQRGPSGPAAASEQIAALAEQQRQLLQQMTALSEAVIAMKDAPPSTAQPAPSVGTNIQSQVAAAVTRSLDARFARYEQIMRSQASTATELRRVAQSVPRTTPAGGGSDAATLREIKAGQAALARRLDELSAKVGQLQRTAQASAQRDEMIRYP